MAAKHPAKHTERVTPKISLHCRLIVHKFFGLAWPLSIQKEIYSECKPEFRPFFFSAPPMTDATTKLSVFTTTMAKTKSSDGPQPTDEVDSKENGEEEPKGMKKE